MAAGSFCRLAMRPEQRPTATAKLLYQARFSSARRNPCSKMTGIIKTPS